MKIPPKPASSVSTARHGAPAARRSMDGDAMDDLLEAKAAHIETDGDEDSTALSWDSLKGDSDQVFSLAMDLLFHPKFSAVKLELAQQQEATGNCPPQRRRRTESPAASRPSWSTASTALTRVSPNWPQSPQSPSADLQAWHDRTLKGQAHRRHQRRLRSRRHGSQSARRFRRPSASHPRASSPR